MTTLGEELPRQMARVRDDVMPTYVSIGSAGSIAVALMRMDLDRAANAMAENDLPEMIKACRRLAEYKI